MNKIDKTEIIFFYFPKKENSIGVRIHVLKNFPKFQRKTFINFKNIPTDIKRFQEISTIFRRFKKISQDF